MNQNAAKVSDQILYMLTNAVEQIYYPGYEIFNCAKSEGFTVAEITNDEVLSFIMPKLQELVLTYLDSARTDEADVSVE